MAEFTEFINTMGFPIAMVLYFIWDKNKTTDKMIENQNKTTETLSKTLDNNTETLNKNTIVLERLLTKLGVEALHVE